MRRPHLLALHNAVVRRDVLDDAPERVLVHARLVHRELHPRLLGVKVGLPRPERAADASLLHAARGR